MPSDCEAFRRSLSAPSTVVCLVPQPQGKQRVCLGLHSGNRQTSFPESESWSGAKSEAKLRKSTKYPGGRRVNSRYARVLRKIPGILTIWPKIWLILGQNQPQTTRLRAKNLTISTQFSREDREEKRGCPQPDPDHPARWVRSSAPRPWRGGSRRQAEHRTTGHTARRARHCRSGGTAARR